MAKIFISYAREDFESAKRLYDFLKSHRQEPWLDKENLLPGQKWQSAIQAAIRESHFFIALLSPHSVEKRGYVQKELRAGLDILEQIPDSEIFLIPARLSECEPAHDRLRELQWVDLFPNWEEGIERLLKVFNFVPKQILEANLSGTKWSSTQSYGDDWTFLLRNDGVVEYDEHGEYFEDGSWTQSGNTLYMEFNGKFAQYRGVIDGHRIIGEAQNIRGKEWKWEAVKIE